MSDKPGAAFALTIAGAVLSLLSALFLALIAGSYDAIIPGLSGLWLAAAVCGLMLSLMVLVLGALLYANPASHRGLGTAIIVLSILGIFVTFLGSIISLIGGVLALTWRPRATTAASSQYFACPHCNRLNYWGVVRCVYCGAWFHTPAGGVWSHASAPARPHAPTVPTPSVPYQAPAPSSPPQPAPPPAPAVAPAPPPPATATVVAPPPKIEDPGHLVGIIGTSQSGKTVYSAVLDWLIGQGRSPLGWKRAPGDTVTSLYVEGIIKGMQAGEWPAPTPLASRQELHVRLYVPTLLSRKIVHIRILDVAGELVSQLTRTDRWEKLTEAQFLVDWLRGCSGLLILLDPAKARGEDGAYQRLLLGLEKTLGVGDTEYLPIPVAFVFTKSDQHRFANPDQFFQALMPELSQVCSVRLKVWKVFSCTAVGSTYDGKPPKRLEPQGVLEPLEFVIDRMR